jgi:dipeptidyl aminopeptidase/acylaminoacyl peptidase
MIAGPGESSYAVYRGLAARLADRGFVVVVPHNPPRGGDAFRVLERKANPLKKSLFSVIAGQHERLLQWLSVQTYVDPKRIGFYGVSYGGKTAMRIPAVLDGYTLSICSADFTEWVWKNTLVDSPYSYLYTGEYEMPEFNLANTFNYSDMAALIAPRPFMVERGHDDPTSPDEWVAHEYAKVRRFYSRLAYPERTNIDFFNGGHTVHGVGTFQFLYRHLDFTRR